MIDTALLLGLIVTGSLLGDASEAGLEGTVQQYWDHLLKGEKILALDYVQAESRANFIARTEPFFRSWKLHEVKARSPREYTVTVKIDRLIQNGYWDWKVAERWSFSEGSWKVRIENGAESRKRFWQGQSTTQLQEGVLDVVPAELRLHFFGGSQKGTIWIRNGNQWAVEMTSLLYDGDRFELLESVESIAAGGVGKITFRYVGSETGKGLSATVGLRLRSGSEETLFSVPVTYNYISDGALGLLGLTRKQAEKLKRGDQVVPRPIAPPRRVRREKP